MRQRARWAVVGSLLAIMAAAPVLTPLGRTAGPRPSTNPADYALIAQEAIKVYGSLSVDRAGIRVNSGELLSPSARLDANGQDIAASKIVLGPGAVCGAAFGDNVTGASATCPESPLGALLDPLVFQIGDACAFPKVVKACGGAGVDVPRSTTRTLAGGTAEAPAIHGNVAIHGSDTTPGVLRLSGGTYVFCRLTLTRGARLFVDGPSQVFITGNLKVSPDAYIGASPSSGTGVEAARFFVQGELVRLSRGARFDGMLCAPRALAALGKDAWLTGQLVANAVRANRAYVNGPASGSTTTSSTILTTTTTTTAPPATTTTSTAPPATTTTSTAPPATTTTSTAPPATTTTSTAPPATTTTSTAPPATTTTSTAPPATTTTSTAPPTTTTTSTTVPTLPTKLKMTIKAGTTSCGGPGFFRHCTGGSNLGGTDGRGSCAAAADCGTNGICSNLGPQGVAPFSGQVSGTAGKLADLGAGCLYIGGGGNVSVGGGAIPHGSSQYFDITATNGANLTLGPSAGVGNLTGYNTFPVGTGNKNCSRGAGPTRHCANAGPTSGQVCTVDADCSALATNVCLPDLNCYFGPPLPIPNPSNPGLSTCVINGFNVDGNGTANTGASGAVTVNIQLSSRIYLTGNATLACPICNAANQCSRGPRAGQACVPNNGANTTSLDCPADGTFQAALPIMLVPLTTGPTQLAAADGRFCTSLGQNVAKAGAFGLKLARTIQESGTPSATGLGAVPNQVSLGSTFCIGSVSATIDPVTALPGPGALSLVTDMSLVP